MNKLILALLILLFSMGAKAQLRVVPFVMCNQPDGFFLSLENIGHQSLRIKKSDLPWMLQSAHVRIWIFAPVNGKLETVKSLRPISDSFYDPLLDLPPGKVYSGFVPFSSLVFDFDKRNSVSEMVILVRTQVLPFMDTRSLIAVPRLSFFNRRNCPAAGQLP